MFSKDFFPTPENLISKMYYKLDRNLVSYILEPSAGKGDLAKGIEEKFKFHNRKVNIDCIELDVELNNYLMANGYNVVWNDFLTYNTYKVYDTLLMNPPFSQGVKHLLKAIQMMENTNGQIVCLLNADTIKNPYSTERQHLSTLLEKYKADIEFIEKGFKQAERKTLVDVALIYLKFESKYRESNIFKAIEFETAKEFKETIEEFKMNQIMLKDDTIKSLVFQYNLECKLLNNLVESYNTFKNYHKSVKDVNNTYRDIVKLNGSSCSNYNEWVVGIREAYWEKILRTEMFNKYLTSNIREQFHELFKKQANIEFNFENILKVQELLMSVFLRSIEDSVEDVFDSLTKHYYNSYTKNIHYYNGWKTNKASRINKKIILPINLYNEWNNTFTLSRYHGRGSINIDEIEKILNYFDGFKPYQSIFNLKVKYNEVENEYIHIKAHKKGTVHIRFKRLDLLDRFNFYVGKKKNWLPNDEDKQYYKTEYQQMKKEIFEYYKPHQEPNIALALPNVA
ncbi:DUF4942 domain-containing protein (plasmid) [Mycoplasmatota bacterium]|nr:DUF4942 domain-containing protein [Mycoplasmatota bacterium]